MAKALNLVIALLHLWNNPVTADWISFLTLEENALEQHTLPTDRVIDKIDHHVKAFKEMLRVLTQQVEGLETLLTRERAVAENGTNLKAEGDANDDF